MRLVVVFTPEAESQLLALYLYIAEAASPDISERYTDAVVNYCESLGMFPSRGALRDDIRPCLRVTHYRGRTVIAFTVLPERVEILGVFHGGRDFPILLREPDL